MRSAADNPHDMHCRSRALLFSALLLLTPLPAPGQVPGESDYVFPLAAPVEHLSWTREHWDGGTAVDIEADQALSRESAAYRAFSSARVRAVTSGIARPADNPRGGTAVVLAGDDGRQYYYAHLAERRVSAPRRVARGAVLGTVGRTGRWTRFLEPHLHFAVASAHYPGLHWENDVSAAAWLEEHFGLPPRPGPADGYPADAPEGWPFRCPGRIAADYRTLAARDPDLAGLALEPCPEGRAVVVSPLGGEVNVIRDSVLGLRVQVTNRPANESILLSGLATTGLQDGQYLSPGARIGTASADRPLLYHYFRNGRLSDPTPTLEQGQPILD